MFRNSIEIESTDPEYLKLEVERITSDIIGIVSHYRNYFYKYGKKSKFYFVYSEKECALLQRLNPDYKKEYYEKYFNSEENKEKIKLLKRCNKALKIMITGYLPGCFYIESSDFDELAYFKYIIEESSDSDLNIINASFSFIPFSLFSFSSSVIAFIKKVFIWENINSVFLFFSKQI